MSQWINSEKQDALAKKIGQIESRTSGEIVVAVFGRSDDYPGARWRVAICLSILVAFAAVLIWPTWDPIWYLWLQLPALAVGYAIGSISAVERLFITDAKAEEEVHQRAVECFHEAGVHSTQNRSGVLIFVSMLEHRVEIIADGGVNIAAGGNDTWKKTVDALVQDIRKGELADGLARAIDSCGEILIRNFPGERPLNELPNHLIIEP